MDASAVHEEDCAGQKWMRGAVNERAWGMWLEHAHDGKLRHHSGFPKAYSIDHEEFPDRFLADCAAMPIRCGAGRAREPPAAFMMPVMGWQAAC